MVSRGTVPSWPVWVFVRGWHLGWVQGGYRAKDGQLGPPGAGLCMMFAPKEPSGVSWELKEHVCVSSATEVSRGHIQAAGCPGHVAS